MLRTSLAERHLQPEIMDQPGLDPADHVRALRGLARINRWSASDRILWPPIAALAREQPGRPLRVLDIATGAGDVPIRLARLALHLGLALECYGIDASATAIEYARATAQAAGVPIEFQRVDALRDELPAGFDVLTSSLFLHHLDEAQAVALLARMRATSARLVLINDLLRSRAGYLLAWFGTRLLSRSHVVHVDGPRSVEGAFTIAEARRLAERAGLAGASCTWRWPWRFLLTWRRPA